MRDHTKLRAFQLADELVLETYRNTARFPKAEQFALTSQIRRAAVSVPSNIVEGCARDTQTDYVRFLIIAHGSAMELQYQITLAQRLGYLGKRSAEALYTSATSVCKVLNALIRSLRKRQYPKPKA